MQRLALLWRGMRWRLGTSALLLVVATVAVFAATAGPLYLATADGTVLHGTLVGAGASQTAVTALATVESRQAAGLAARALALERASPMGRYFSRGMFTEDVGIRVGVDQALADLIYRPGVCAHLHFLAGHCAHGSREVVLTQEDVQFLHLKLGGRLVPEVPKSHAVGRNRHAPGKTIVPLEPSGQSLQVVGIVAEGLPASPYWLGDNFFGFSPSAAPPQLDAMWTSPGAVAGQYSISMAQFPLRVPRAKVAQLARISKTVGAYESMATRRLGLVLSSDLFDTIGNYQHEANVMAAIVVVVDLQLVLLTLVVLYGLVVRTEETRLKEVALTKLHGFPRSAVVSAGLAEPMALVLIALPLGFLLAWGVVALGSGALLGGSPLLFTLPVFLAALAAFAGGLIATSVGSRRILNRRLLEEVQGTNVRPSVLGRALLDGGAVALAVGGLVELVHSGVLSGGQPNPLALLTPGLVAVAVAVVGLRLLPRLCRWGLGWTEGSHHLATSLAVRQVLRRPTLSRQRVVVVVANALAGVAGGAWSVANANRVERADFETGAAQVLNVRVPPSVSLMDAVRRADPSGRYAMAVVATKSFGQHLIAFDAARLARVAYWPADISHTSLARVVRWLRGRIPPQLVLTGTEVRVRLNYFGLPAGPPDLQFNLIDNGGFISVADFGYLRTGVHTYQASLPASCVGGCRVTSVQPYWAPNNTGLLSTTFSIQFLQVQAGRPGHLRSPAVPLGETRYWLASPDASMAKVGKGVLFTFNELPTELLPPAVIPAPLPSTLPGVSTYASQPSNPGVGSDIDFDGTPIYLNTKVETLALPGVGQYGVLIDLPVAIDSETSYPVGAQDYVWLAPDAPRGMVSALRRQGLYIRDRSTPARLLARYQQSGPALANLFFLFAAAAAAVLAVGSSVLALTLSSRQRAYETSMLTVAGISRRSLYRALVGEQLLILIPGAVLGMAAGLGAAVAALPSVPEFVSLAGGPPLQLGLPVVPALALFAGLLVLLTLGAMAAAYSTMRLVTVERLRMEII